jgi:hypothetical protein
MAELLRATADTLAAKEAGARLEGELAVGSEAVVASARGVGAKPCYYHVRRMPGL